MVPIENLIGEDCFHSYNIAHMRDTEGYRNTWYDKEDDEDNVWSSYEFTTYPTIQSDIYFSVATYSNGIVPNECTTKNVEDEYGEWYQTTVPISFISIYLGWQQVFEAAWFDYAHSPILGEA